MSIEASRKLLIVEAFVIVLPISLLALLVTGFWINQTRRLIGFDVAEVQAVLALFSIAALCSGWQLFFAFTRDGTGGLQRKHLAWWAIITGGVLILLASTVYRSLQHAEGASHWWYWLQGLSGFNYGLPVLIPLAHLTYERFFRGVRSNTSGAIGG
jgi:hypothetical protein